MDDVGRGDVDDDRRVDRDHELAIGEGALTGDAAGVLESPQPLLADRGDLQWLALGGDLDGGLPPGGAWPTVASAAEVVSGTETPLTPTCAVRDADAVSPSGPLGSTVRALSVITIPKMKIARAGTARTTATREIAWRPAVIRAGARPRRSRKRTSAAISATLTTTITATVTAIITQ